MVPGPSLSGILDRPIVQLAFVVYDLDRALERYSRVFGPASWRCFSFSAAIHAEAEYHGRPTGFSAGLALNSQSPQLELIEPRQGPSIHRDWLDSHGESAHHVGIAVDSLADATRRMTEVGYRIIQSGSGFGAAGDGAYAYYDTERDLGLIVEAFEPPERLRDPEYMWPAPGPRE